MRARPPTLAPSVLSSDLAFCSPPSGPNLACSYPNYIYHPGTDRPKPTRAPRVHKGSKAAGSKAAAAAKKAASKKGKDRQDDDQLRAAEELERAADDDDDDGGDYQPYVSCSLSASARRRSVR